MGKPVQVDPGLTETVATRITPAELQQLEQIARREDRTVASIIRRAVRRYLDDKRKGLI